MRLPKFNHISPVTIEEACILMEQCGPEAKILAGGTDLLVSSKLRISRPTHLVSLKGVKELKGVAFKEGEGLRIGAMTSLKEMIFHPEVQRYFPALYQAASAVGTPQLREMGTLGGNLCLNTRCIFYNQSDHWRRSRSTCFKMGGNVCHVVPGGKKCYAVFTGDMAPVLMVLNAKVKVVCKAGERWGTVGDLYSGEGKEPLALHSSELVSEIFFPLATGNQSSVYLKYRVRDAIDFPQAGVAVWMQSKDSGLCTGCKVALTAVDSAPAEIPEAGEWLSGKILDVHLVSQVAKKTMERAHPVANTLGSTPAYRRKMVEILTKRALFAVANQLALMK